MDYGQGVEILLIDFKQAQCEQLIDENAADIMDKIGKVIDPSPRGVHVCCRTFPPLTVLGGRFRAGGGGASVRGPGRVRELSAPLRLQRAPNTTMRALNGCRRRLPSCKKRGVRDGDRRAAYS